MPGQPIDRLDGIEAADPYPGSYDATRDCNVSEQRANARPAIAKPLPSIGQYDTVLLAGGADGESWLRRAGPLTK